MTQTSATSPELRLTAAERAERNRRIAEARAAGESWKVIAAREGVSVRTAQRHVADHLRSAGLVARRLSEIDGDALLARIIDAQEQALSAAVVEMLTGDNSSARIGAARTVSGVGTALHLTLVRSGLVGDPGLSRFTAEIEKAVRVMFALADRHGIPADEVVAEVERLPLPSGFSLVGEAA